MKAIDIRYRGAESLLGAGSKGVAKHVQEHGAQLEGSSPHPRVSSLRPREGCQQTGRHNEPVSGLDDSSSSSCRLRE
jgi:hypothetical protein